MAITSANKLKRIPRYGSSQLGYALTYMLITTIVLFLLNFYCSETSQQLFYRSKEESMIEKCQLVAAEVSSLEVLNTATVSGAIADMDSLRTTRLIVTDASGIAIYDSSSQKCMSVCIKPNSEDSFLENNVSSSEFLQSS